MGRVTGELGEMIPFVNFQTRMQTTEKNFLTVLRLPVFEKKKRVDKSIKILNLFKVLNYSAALGRHDLHYA